MHEQTQERLAGVFRRYPSVQAVYLFGSTAEGRDRLGSDLDLAVIADVGLGADAKLDILADLAREGFCNVDLVVLDDRDIVLAYEAVRLNRLVYARSDFDRGATYSKVVRRYLDFEPYLHVQREAFKRRMLRGAA